MPRTSHRSISIAVVAVLAAISLGSLAPMAVAETAVTRDKAATVEPASPAPRDPEVAAGNATAPDWSALDWNALTATAAPDQPAHGRIKTPNPAAPPLTAFATRNENQDGSATVTMGSRLPTAWETKFGLDLGLAAAPPTSYQPDQPPAAVQSPPAGAAWASVTVPGPATPLAWDKAAFDARIDPTHDAGKLGTTLSRSLPIGSDLSLTLQNGYAVTQPLSSGAPLPSTANSGAAAAAPSWSTDRKLRLNILPSGTSLSAGAQLSSTDDKWLRSLGAEQKLFGGPVIVTGSASETASGEIAKSISAGFKRSW